MNMITEKKCGRCLKDKRGWGGGATTTAQVLRFQLPLIHFVELGESIDNKL